MIALVLLVGCYTYTETHCETVARDVTDDERLDLGFTVTEALARIDPQTVEAIDLFGNVVAIDVSFVRGDGTATVEDASVIEEVVREGGRNTSNTWVGGDPICIDVVDVPITVTMTGDGVAASGSATFSNDPLAFEFETFDLTYPVDAGADTLPEGLHGPAVGGNVFVTYLDGEIAELEAIVVTEDGTRETVLWFMGSN
ncbi:MAG: hypothetical protein Q8P41_20855 [Pseudomonadota bacterium]|nr:hypothetical protein [Pseudomonadota bacterium]